MAGPETSSSDDDEDEEEDDVSASASDADAGTDSDAEGGPAHFPRARGPGAGDEDENTIAEWGGALLASAAPEEHIPEVEPSHRCAAEEPHGRRKRCFVTAEAVGADLSRRADFVI